MVGIVLAMFEVGLLVTSPLISMTLQKFGKKNYILLGILLTILASVGFGLLVYIKNDTTFYILSLFLRFL